MYFCACDPSSHGGPTRAPSSPKYKRFPPSRCLVWSAWFARSYRRQGEATRQPNRTTVIPSTPPRVSSLALPNSAKTRPMASSSHRLQGFLHMSAPVRSIRDVAPRCFSGAAWPGSGITQLAVGPFRRRHRRPPFPVLMHKSTTIPGHGVCRGQGLLVVSSCPLTAALGRQFGSGE